MFSNGGVHYQGIQPINRYSLGNHVIAGQYKRIGGTNFFKSNTNIQMNFNGVNPFGAYDYGCCNSKPTFLENLITALGFAGALAGPLIGLFGKKDGGDDGTVKDEKSKGGDDAGNNNVGKTPADNSPKIENNDNNDNNVNNDNNGKIPAKQGIGGLEKGMQLSLHDDMQTRKMLPIQGEITDIQGDIVTLKDSTSGSDNLYKIKVTTDANGKISSLEVLSKNGKTATTSNKYEMHNGKWEDVSTNKGQGLKFEGDASPAAKKTAAAKTKSTAPASHSGKPELKDGYSWQKANNLPPEVKGNIKNGMSVKDLCKELGINPENPKNIQYLEQMNPNGIKNGKVADVNKLDVIYKAAPAKADVKNENSEIPATLKGPAPYELPKMQWQDNKFQPTKTNTVASNTKTVANKPSAALTKAQEEVKNHNSSNKIYTINVKEQNGKLVYTLDRKIGKMNQKIHDIHVTGNSIKDVEAKMYDEMKSFAK